MYKNLQAVKGSVIDDRVSDWSKNRMTIRNNVKKIRLPRLYAPRRYPYFEVVVGFVWSHNPKSYAGGSICYW
jgi:hypothetical protein